MSDESGGHDVQPGTHVNGAHELSQEADYDPGDTLNRGMSIGCTLVLLFFALISCGFIYSVLSSRH